MILHNLKNVKITKGKVLLIVKLQAKACNLLKVTLIHGCFSRFLNCTMVPNHETHLIYVSMCILKYLQIL